MSMTICHLGLFQRSSNFQGATDVGWVKMVVRRFLLLLENQDQDLQAFLNEIQSQAGLDSAGLLLSLGWPEIRSQLSPAENSTRSVGNCNHHMQSMLDVKDGGGIPLPRVQCRRRFCQRFLSREPVLPSV